MGALAASNLLEGCAPSDGLWWPLRQSAARRRGPGKRVVPLHPLFPAQRCISVNPPLPRGVRVIAAEPREAPLLRPIPALSVCASRSSSLSRRRYYHSLQLHNQFADAPTSRRAVSTSGMLCFPQQCPERVHPPTLPIQPSRSRAVPSRGYDLCPQVLCPRAPGPPESARQPPVTLQRDMAESSRLDPLCSSPAVADTLRPQPLVALCRPARSRSAEHQWIPGFPATHRPARG